MAKFWGLVARSTTAIMAHRLSQQQVPFSLFLCIPLHFQLLIYYLTFKFIDNTVCYYIYLFTASCTSVYCSVVEFTVLFSVHIMYLLSQECMEECVLAGVCGSVLSHVFIWIDLLFYYSERCVKCSYLLLYCRQVCAGVAMHSQHTLQQHQEWMISQVRLIPLPPLITHYRYNNHHLHQPL